MSEQHGSAAPGSAGNPGEGAPPASGGGNFLESLTPEARAVAEVKQWDNPSAAIGSYKNLETLMGEHNAGNTIALPKAADDKGAYDAIYDRLGRPKEAAEYKIPDPPDGVTIDADFVNAARPALHEIGLSQSQFEKAAGWYNTYTAERMKAIDTAMVTEAKAQEDALRLDWGDKYDARMETARRVVKMVPSDIADGAKVLDTLEAAGIPRGDIFRMFAWFGESVMESKMAGDGANAFAASPDTAKAEIERLKMDTEFQGNLMDGQKPGHKTAKEKWDALHATAYPS